MYRDRKGNYHKKPKNITPKKRKSSYGIYIRNNEILLVKPVWTNYLEIPRGGVENDENLIQALKREFLEETGFLIKKLDENPIHKTTTKFYADDLDIFYSSELNFFIIKELENQNQKLVDKTEIREIKFVKISELTSKNMNDFQLEIIKVI